MSAEILAAIGAVTVEFANLEMHLEAAIWSVPVGTRLEDQATGRLVTAELSFQKRLHLFEALIRHRDPGRDDGELRQLRAQLSQAEQERNQIVHSTWIGTGEEVLRYKTTVKGQLRTQTARYTATDVEAVAARIHSAVEELSTTILTSLSPGIRDNKL
jgi:hypothetical protein